MFRFKSFLVFICFSLLCVGLSCSSVFATTLLIDADGRLYGAEDVLLNGIYYDVEFVSGTAYDLFLVDEEYIFAFSTSAEASAASSALFNDVFIDTVDGSFDSDPSQIRGNASDIVAELLTPYDTWFYGTNDQRVNASVANNTAWDTYETPDGIWIIGDYTTDDAYTPTAASTILGYESSLYAIWTPSQVTTVPEPTTILLVGSGLISLAGLAKKKHFKA